MKSKLSLKEDNSKVIQGELYICKEGESITVVICNESTSKSTFKATCLFAKGSSVWKVGEFCDVAVTYIFKPFKGTLELTGE